jgi:hypothetical protein
MKEDQMKLCVDCEHRLFMSSCRLTERPTTQTDLIYGEHNRPEYSYCGTERRTGACGPEGKNYKRIWWKVWRPK